MHLQLKALDMRKGREFRGGDKGGDIQEVSEERKRDGEREGEVTVPRADFHELRNHRRTARPWHQLPLIFYCPCLCCRSPRRLHAATMTNGDRRYFVMVKGYPTVSVSNRCQ